MASNLKGAIVNFLDGFPDALPGGAHADEATSDRPAGAFVVVTNDHEADTIHTTGPRVDVRRVDVVFYAGSATEAANLSRQFVPDIPIGADPTMLRDPSSYQIDRGGIICVFPDDGGGDGPTETIDFAPKGSTRLYQMTRTLKAWISVHFAR